MKRIVCLMLVFSMVGCSSYVTRTEAAAALKQRDDSLLTLAKAINLLDARTKSLVKEPDKKK